MLNSKEQEEEEEEEELISSYIVVPASIQINNALVRKEIMSWTRTSCGVRVYFRVRKPGQDGLKSGLYSIPSRKDERSKHILDARLS